MVYSSSLMEVRTGGRAGRGYIHDELRSEGVARYSSILEGQVLVGMGHDEAIASGEALR